MRGKSNIHTLYLPKMSEQTDASITAYSLKKTRFIMYKGWRPVRLRLALPDPKPGTCRGCRSRLWPHVPRSNVRSDPPQLQKIQMLEGRHIQLPSAAPTEQTPDKWPQVMGASVWCHVAAGPTLSELSQHRVAWRLWQRSSEFLLERLSCFLRALMEVWCRGWGYWRAGPCVI